MKNVNYVCFIIITSLSFMVNNNCEYKGLVSKLIFRESNKKMHVGVIEQGEMNLFLEIKNCKCKNKKIELTGTVQSLMPKNGKITSAVSEILILKCLRKDKEYFINDTLAITDKEGFFYIKTSKFKNEYLMIKQNELSGMCYELSKFK
jgi:hypothetical protein